MVLYFDGVDVCSNNEGGDVIYDQGNDLLVGRNGGTSQNYDFGGRTGIVDLYVSYLRKKVDAGRVPMIHTVRGIGYLLRSAD